MTLLRTPLSREEKESDQKNPKKMSFQRSHGKTGRISMGVFPNRPTIGTFSPSKMEHFLTGDNSTEYVKRLKLSSLRLHQS